MAPHLITIPTGDSAFRHFVQRTYAKIKPASVNELESRLKRTYARVHVRERELAGESQAWYVYRDGAWRAPDGNHWWEDPSAPRVEASADGWIEQANPTARDLLGLDSTEPRHFTDFTVAGGVDDAVALFDIVRATGGLEATVLVQPTSGDVIAADIRVVATAQGVVAVFRLATDVDPAPLGAPRQAPPNRLEYVPATDVAFRSYAERALGRMPEPTTGGLALRLRRLYPHAQVTAHAGGWVVRRDRESVDAPKEAWWLGEGLPKVRYDSLALILEANDAATSFFGRRLVGHHWQEFVTAGSTEEVSVMLEILAEAGAAESRFRMPRGDGSLIEFDSYTVAEDGGFSTIFRPVPEPARRPDPSHGSPKESVR